MKVAIREYIWHAITAHCDAITTNFRHAGFFLLFFFMVLDNFEN
jgi:hypothetical protein